MWDVLIVGGGPAGATAATSLAERGYRVLLLERKTFPREKLCGEFLWPDGVALLRQLGLFDAVCRAGAHPIRHAALVSARGRRWSFPLDRLAEGFGLGVSRVTLDALLLEHARHKGAYVLEGFCVREPLEHAGRIVGVSGIFSASGRRASFSAPIVLDASGRCRALGQGEDLVRRDLSSSFFAFQLHVSGVEGEDDAVTLYFYPSGYGGIVRIEGGLYNLCALTTWETIRRAGNRLEALLDATLRQNPQARERLRAVRAESAIRGCGPLTFGLRSGASAAIGDALAQTDPFLGHGICSALESGRAIAALLHELSSRGDPTRLPQAWARLSRRLFARRWIIGRLCRPTAFHPDVGDLWLRLLPTEERILRPMLRLLRATSADPLA